jgi:hypothetical protein
MKKATWILAAMVLALAPSSASASDVVATATESLAAFTAPVAPLDRTFGRYISESVEKYKAGQLNIAPYRTFGLWVAAHHRKHDARPGDGIGKPGNGGPGSGMGGGPGTNPGRGKGRGGHSGGGSDGSDGVTGGMDL